jgi:hypothetical protein
MTDAAERKRKRLEAWRKRQQEQVPAAVTLTLSKNLIPKKKKLAPAVLTYNAFGDGDDDDDDDKKHLSKKPMLDFENETSKGEGLSSRKRRRWDVEGVGDALDTFMDKLQAGAMGSVSTVQADVALSVNVGGSMMRQEQPRPAPIISGQVVTDEQVALLNTKVKKNSHAHYTPSDWESEPASEADTEDEEEDARRSFMEAVKSASTPMMLSENPEAQHHLNTAAEVRTEKQRREDRLKQLEHDADAARHAAFSESEFGRLYNDGEDGIMEEAERNLDAAMATPDALEVLAELNKKKELKSVDHSQIDYLKFRKNLYIVPRSLANLSQDEVINRRAKLKVRVRGKAAPAPVSSWTECGLSERIIQILEHQQILHPYAIQAQCIPCIMAGRDVIGIAKTGSGKTLAYLLPLLRHIGDQPPLGPLESGPIGLILAPARELAAQIHSVCRVFCKSLGFK